MKHHRIARAEVGIAAHHRADLCPGALTLRRLPAITASFKMESFAQPADAEEMAKRKEI